MGIFDRFLLRKKAREMGFTLEQYEEYMQYQQSDNLSAEDYRMYLSVYARQMQVREFIDQVLRVRPTRPATRRRTERPVQERPVQEEPVQEEPVQATTVQEAPALEGHPVRRRRRQAMLNMEQTPQQSVPIEPKTPVFKEPEEAVSPEVQACLESIRRSTQKAIDTATQITQRLSAAREAAAAKAREEAAAKAREEAAAKAREEAEAKARETAAAMLVKAEIDDAVAKAMKDADAAREKAELAIAKMRAEFAAAQAREATAAKAGGKAAIKTAQPMRETGKDCGGLYPIGGEPPKIRERLDRLFAKLDSAYPDKVIVALTKNHGHWAETVTELYRLLGYPDSWSFLEAYGYQVKVNEENGKGGRPVKDRTAVIDELKRRYPQPVEGSIAFLMEQNPDLAPRIKTLQNSAQTVFGMRLADYLKQEGILAEKKVEPKSEKPVVKQFTPEEKLEQIISELKRRYPTLKSAPKSLTELKEKNADLPMATLNTLTQKVVQKTAGEYCLELGLICDKERMKKDALESASDGRDGWGRQFSQTILERGVNMFVAGEVKSLARTADGYAAEVKGTSMYSVRIETAGDEVRSMSCTCPYAADGLNCKHMAAVLFEANAKLYAPKVKKPQPVYGHATDVVSRSCADNEILIISKDEAVLREAVNCSYIDSDRVSIHPCSENPAYYLCEVRIDERRINLSGLMDMVICPMLDGRGVALGRKVDNEHEVSDIGFYDGECLWAGSEFDLMYPDSDAPDEPEEWVYECNSKKNRTWGQSKKVWKKIWNKIPYYKVSDLIATYEENCMAALTSAKESSKVSRDADRRCEPGELLIVSNYYDGIEQIVYEQEEIEPKNGIRQCTKSPDTWYAVFDLKACADVEETLNALLDMIEGDMIILARWKDETGSNRVWFFDSDNLWTNMLEEDLAKNKDPQEEFDRYHQEICGIRDEEQTEAMWRYVRSRLLGMTTVDWAHFIETYSTEEDE